MGQQDDFSGQGAAAAPAWDPSLYQQAHSFVWETAGDVLAALQPQAGERILDLGCGTGQLTACIADAGAEVLGVDSSPEMIREARANYPKLEFRVDDARRFSVESRFDAVFSNAMLHWILDAEAVIRQVALALRPGGRFVAEFGGRGNVGRIVGNVQGILTAKGYPCHSPWYFPTVGEYATLLEFNGFEVSSASLTDRPTRLADAELGMRHWMEMFGQPLLERVPPSRHAEVLSELEIRLRPALFRDAAWFADYRRLRVHAVYEPRMPDND